MRCVEQSVLGLLRIRRGLLTGEGGGRVQASGASGGRLVFEGPVLVYATSSDSMYGCVDGRACVRACECECVRGLGCSAWMGGCECEGESV